MARYTTLAISDPDDLLFGMAPKPITTRHGLVLGGGLVYPEINFTLPPMTIGQATWPDVRRHYEEIIEEVLKRAAELETPGVVVECAGLRGLRALGAPFLISRPALASPCLCRFRQATEKAAMPKLAPNRALSMAITPHSLPFDSRISHQLYSRCECETRLHVLSHNLGRREPAFMTGL
jgi:hypothetical protein